MYGCVKYLFILLSCMGICFPSSAQDSPIEVTAAYPVASQKYQSITLSGAVSSANDAFLAPLQAGLVDKLFVEVGDHVQQGQPLLTLDSKLAELAPLVVIPGEGTELYRGVGIIVLSGIFVSTVLSVTFLPALLVTVLARFAPKASTSAD